MPRGARVAPGGLVYHVLNRSVAGLPLFRKEKEAEAVRTCIARNRPFGSEAWQNRQAKRLELLHTLRSEGRPKAIKPKH